MVRISNGLKRRVTLSLKSAASLFTLALISVSFIGLAAARTALVGSVDLPGSASDVFVSGSYAYVAGNADGLHIVRVSDPQSPVVVGSIDTPGNTNRVFVSGSYAFAADGDAGLQVVDVTEPQLPHIVGSVDTNGWARHVFVSLGHAFVTVSSEGLYSRLDIVDVSDPANPAIVGSVNTPGAAREVFVSGNHAYVADGSSGLQIVNTTDPQNPAIIGSVPIPSGDALHVFVSEGYAFVTHGAGNMLDTLQVIDVRDPGNPVAVGSAGTEGLPGEVFVSGNYAYIAGSWNGIEVVDTTDPTAPVRVGSVDVAGYVDNVFISGGNGYLVQPVSGSLSSRLEIVDVSRPKKVTTVGSIDIPYAHGVFVADDFAYVTTFSELELVNVSDTANPFIFSSTPVSGLARTFVSGNHVYVAEARGELKIFSALPPRNPKMIGSLDTRAPAYDVFVFDDYAYVAAGPRGLLVIDVKRPARPVLVGSLDTPGEARRVFVSDGYAYIADGLQRVQVVNIARPRRPVLVGMVGISGIPEGLFVENQHAYVSGQSFGLQVIDVSDPNSPVVTGTVDTPGGARDVFVSEGYAFVADGCDSVAVNGSPCFPSGLTIVDMSDPHHPELVRSVATRYDSRGVFVKGGYAYLAEHGSPQGSGCLEVMDVSDFQPGAKGIYGWLKSEDGPLTSAVVELFRREANQTVLERTITTGQDGIFTFENLEEGRYVLSAQTPSLGPRGELFGRVTVNSLPLISTPVKLFRQVGPKLTRRGLKRTDDNGRFKFRQPVQGSYCILLEQIRVNRR